MIISEAIDLLQETELKQLKLKVDKAVVTGFLNSAILAIYKRFNLWEAEASITIAAATTLYDLDGVDANVTIDLSDHQFLFTEEVWLIADETYEEDEKLTINDRRAINGVHTPKFNRIRISNHDDTVLLTDRVLKVIYRGAPLSLTNEKAVIPLPPQFQEPLFHYVGFRAHGSVKGDEKSENNTHFRRFEKSCDRIVFDGLYNQDSMTSVKFDDSGMP